MSFAPAPPRTSAQRAVWPLSDELNDGGGGGGGIDEGSVLAALRVAMWAHAFLDAAGAVALFFTPHIVSALAPALCAEAYALRIVAAALLAIAYASARAASYEHARHFVPLLQFKVVWSTTVWIGLAWSIAEFAATPDGVPLAAWLTLGVFLTGSAIWWTFALLLASLALRARRRRAFQAQMRARSAKQQQ